MTKTGSSTLLANRIFQADWAHGSTWSFPDFPDPFPSRFSAYTHRTTEGPDEPTVNLV